MVVQVQLVERVVAAGDVHAPRLVVQVVVLPDAGELQTLDVQVAAGHVQALDAAVVLHRREVEHRLLARVRGVGDRRRRGAALRQRDRIDQGGPAGAGLGGRGEGVRPGPEVDRVTGTDRRLGPGDALPRGTLGARRRVAAVGGDVVRRAGGGRGDAGAAAERADRVRVALPAIRTPVMPAIEMSRRGEVRGWLRMGARSPFLKVSRARCATDGDREHSRHRAGSHLQGIEPLSGSVDSQLLGNVDRQPPAVR